MGAGAMGSLFGGYLSAAGHEVWLVDTVAEHVDVIVRQGLHIMEPHGEERVVRPRAVTDPRSVGPCDLVLVFVKSYHTRQVASSLFPLLGPSTVVLTLQNGLGNVDVLAEKVPRSHLMAGTTGQGANVLGPGCIHHAGSGETLIGELDGALTDRLARMVEALTGAGLAASASTNVQGAIWAKLLVNVAINPLTAILRVRNGQLLEMPEAVEVMREAVSEGLAVASRAGVQVPLEEPWEHVRDVARRTGDNRSSMLQDVEKGRQTEIDVINGAIVREGFRLGLEVPVNLTLMRLVKCLEQSGSRG